jgi:hypothetical protein
MGSYQITIILFYGKPKIYKKLKFYGANEHNLLIFQWSYYVWKYSKSRTIYSLKNMSHDPYKLTKEGIKPAPKSIFGKLKYLGPGFILSASVVGSGELISATNRNNTG